MTDRTGSDKAVHAVSDGLAFGASAPVDIRSEDVVVSGHGQIDEGREQSLDLPILLRRCDALEDFG